MRMTRLFYLCLALAVGLVLLKPDLSDLRDYLPFNSEVVRGDFPNLVSSMRLSSKEDVVYRKEQDWLVLGIYVMEYSVAYRAKRIKVSRHYIGVANNFYLLAKERTDS